MSRIGYARVSTSDQNPDSQRDALLAAGCEKIFTDKVTGKLASRPGWDTCLEYLRPGDALVITRLSRAARSLRNLLDVADQLRGRGIDLVVLKQAIDTTTPAGRLAFHVMAAIDEFQRELIVEGTVEGLAAARARGRAGGRKPKLSPAQAQLARRLYDERGPDGKRAHTVEHIAGLLGVTKPTIYRHLSKDAAPALTLITTPPADGTAPARDDAATAEALRGLNWAGNGLGAAAEPEPAAEPRPGPRREPRITPTTEYELVKASDHTETGAWLVMADGTQVGRVSHTLEGTGTTAWQATSNAGVHARCAGKGATRGGNARTRDRAAAELMMMLMRIQHGTRASR